MNKSKIEWCDRTFNPITGCFGQCPYCYARKIALRFAGTIQCVDYSKQIHELDEPLYTEDDFGKLSKAPYPFYFQPTFHKYRLDEPQKIKKTQNIFVCSMADLFGDWVPGEWIAEVFKACKAAPQHNYLFLTKNPHRYFRFLDSYRKNYWFGTTATDNDSFSRNCFELWQSVEQCVTNVNRFMSIEPLSGEINQTELKAIQVNDWIIIGAETGNRKGKVIPKATWIAEIVFACDEAGVPVFMKDSLIPIVGEANMRREFPDGLKKDESK